MPEVVIVGCGEVGVAYAEGVRGLDPAPMLHLMDPKPGPAGVAFAESAGLAIHREASPAGDRRRGAVGDPGGAAGTSAPLAAAAAVSRCGGRRHEYRVRGGRSGRRGSLRAAGAAYVDVAITGSVALSKARTPLLYAGPEVPALLSTVHAVRGAADRSRGTRSPVDAMRVKLLRSVVMKGLEGLVVECLPAAQEYGVLDQLWASLGDVDRTGFVALLQAMTRTHPRHAARRQHEVADAAAQLEAIGYPSANDTGHRAAVRRHQRRHHPGSAGPSTTPPREPSPGSARCSRLPSPADLAAVNILGRHRRTSF